LIKASLIKTFFSEAERSAFLLKVNRTKVSSATLAEIFWIKSVGEFIGAKIGFWMKKVGQTN
jgi:hypothetical protein